MCRLLARALTVVALLTSCGSGDDADRTAVSSTTAESSVTTTATVTSTTTPGTVTSATTGAIPEPSGVTSEPSAQAIILTLADFPQGWQQNQAPVEDDRFDKNLRACIGVPVQEEGLTAKAAFSMGSALQVSSAVNIVSSSEVAEGNFDALSGPKLNGCLQQVFDQIFANEAGGAATVDTRVENVDFPSVAEGSVARRITLRAAAGNNNGASVVIDVVLALNQRVEMSFGFVSVGHPFPHDLAVQLTSAMAARA